MPYTFSSYSDRLLTGPEGGWSISINEVKLEVTQGDITESTTDAIVNSTNEDLNLRLGRSYRLYISV